LLVADFAYVEAEAASSIGNTHCNCSAVTEVIAAQPFVTGAVVFSGDATTGGASATGTAVGAGACTSGADSSAGTGVGAVAAPGAVSAGAVSAAGAVAAPFGQEQRVAGQFPTAQLSLHQDLFTALLKLLQCSEGSHSQNSATQFCVLPLQLVSHHASSTLGTMLWQIL